MNLPDIVYLELKESQLKPIIKGELGAPKQMITRVYDFSNRGTRGAVTGSLTVAMTTENILHKLQKKVIVILIMQSIKTLSVTYGDFLF